MFKQWEGFNLGNWTEEINVRNFIQKNYNLYEGNDSFLEATTEKTKKIWDESYQLIVKEIKEGVAEIETTKFSGIDNFEPGYLDKENELIVGFQTDSPLKRIMNPYGGMRMVEQSISSVWLLLCKKA
jgi:Pyruvate-formate lyase